MKSAAARIVSPPGILALGALVACGREEGAPPKLEPASLGTMERVHACGDVWLASQPSEEDLRALPEKGIRTVVNLRAREEWPFDEEAAAAGLGLRYVHLPITAETLSMADVERFEGVLEDPAAGPVFVHCRSASRVGAVWALYRMRRENVPRDAALEEAREIGMKGEALEAFVAAHAPE